LLGGGRWRGLSVLSASMATTTAVQDVLHLLLESMLLLGLGLTVGWSSTG
jgi:hypothetical protein